MPGMKLQKSPAGKILMIVYYIVVGIAAFIFMLFIMSKAGVLAGLGAALVMGVIIGITGGELEFRMHNKIKRKRRFGKKKEEVIAKRIIEFPAKDDIQ